MSNSRDLWVLRERSGMAFGLMFDEPPKPPYRQGNWEPISNEVLRMLVGYLPRTKTAIRIRVEVDDE